jgi:zinc protease
MLCREHFRHILSIQRLDQLAGQEACRGRSSNEQPVLDTVDPHLFTIRASLVDKNDMGYVMGEIEKAIEKVQKEGVDAKQLERTKSHLKYDFAMQMDTPTNIAESLSHYIWLTGDPESVNRLYALYDKVTVDDIKAVAEKYLQPERLTIATISDDEKGALK